MKKIILVSVIIAMAFVWGCHIDTAEPEHIPEETAAVEIVDETEFNSKMVSDEFSDETIKENVECGEVRKVTAWWYEDNGKTLQTIEDETGNLWWTDGEEVGMDEVLILWINDNNTPNDVKDDVIINIERVG